MDVVKKLATLKSNVYEYEKRREVFRKKHGWKHGRPTTLKYKIDVAKLEKKIRSWKSMILEIKNRPKYNRSIKEMHKLTTDYIGVTFKINSKSRTDEMKFITASLYKYMLDNGIPNRAIFNYFEINKDTATKLRKSFTKSFYLNTSIGAKYHRYREYMDSHFKTKSE